MICRGVILSGRQSCKLGALDKVCLVQTALWLIWPSCIKIRGEVAQAGLSLEVAQAQVQAQAQAQARGGSTSRLVT